jgi:hypothetical protein
MIAPHFSLPVSVLLGLALIPTIIHEYVGLAVQDGRVTSAVSMDLAGFKGSATGRKSAWVVRKFDGTDWIERWYTAENDRLQLLIVRSYDLKRLYHHPELAIVQDDDLISRGIIRLPKREYLPIHVLESSRTDGRGVALYALHYDKEFVDNPLRFQIRTAASLLVSGRRQMTLFFVHDSDVPPESSLKDLHATQVLLEAVDSFLGQEVKTAASARRACGEGRTC